MFPNIQYSHVRCTCTMYILNPSLQDIRADGVCKRMMVKKSTRCMCVWPETSKVGRVRKHPLYRNTEQWNTHGNFPISTYQWLFTYLQATPPVPMTMYMYIHIVYAIYDSWGLTSQGSIGQRYTCNYSLLLMNMYHSSLSICVLLKLLFHTSRIEMYKVEN